MNRRARLVTTAIAAVAAVALAGCTATGATSTAPAAPGAKASGAVELWNFYTDREAQVFESVVKDFQASHPDIQVTVKGGQDDEQMGRAVSAGEGPDIGLSYDTLVVGNSCRTGAFRDLTPYIQRDNIDLNKIPATVRAYTEYDGKRCTMPALTDTYGLYYNKAMLGSRTPPKTWSELTQLAKDLTKRSPSGEIEVAGFVPLMGFYENQPSRFGPGVEAKWLNPDGTSAIGSDPGWKQFLTWQKEFVDWYGYDNLQKFVAGLGQEFSADNAFQTGKVAMNIDGEFRVAFLKDQAPNLQFGTAPLPTPDDKAANYGAGFITGNIIGITRSSKNPEAAWELVKYLTTDTGALVKLSNGLRNVPTTTDALSSPQLQIDPAFQTFIDILKNPKSSSTPPTGNGNAYIQSFTDWAQEWQSGKVTDLGASLKQLDTQIDAAQKVTG
ncbi:ABC transporter substrate-binding protein [Pseudonocardia sp. GCM10023141]|uniref:ABC transporter substrate-binding protein n=1 Tax=Pseudonocardia sp. GCM10023141 TaxID=3252653 RepID=UPI003608BB34